MLSLRRGDWVAKLPWSRRRSRNIPCSRAFAAFLAVALARVAIPGTSAQPLSPTETRALDRLCLQGAAQAPSSLATEIASTALREHAAFGGHVIDRDGRMLRFGAVESEATRDPPSEAGIPWRQVLRFWETLGPLDGMPLQVRSFPGLVDNAGATGPEQLRPLNELRERLARSSLPTADREALTQAAFRAALVDVPWSAAFVSHVVLTAGMARPRFVASFAHVDYVAEAARRSRDDLAGTASTTFYRACDPRRTPMRPGDLLCGHRHAPGDIAALGFKDSLFSELTSAFARGDRPVWNLHCDIVTGRDHRRRTATLVGGNVLQSVTKRELRTDRRGALAAPRRLPACLDDQPPGPLCRPESGPWFVLLQATDAPRD